MVRPRRRGKEDKRAQKNRISVFKKITILGARLVVKHSITDFDEKSLELHINEEPCTKH